MLNNCAQVKVELVLCWHKEPLVENPPTVGDVEADVNVVRPFGENLSTVRTCPKNSRYIFLPLTEKTTFRPTDFQCN